MNNNNLDNWLGAAPQRTLSDYAANKLREAILLDIIKPGQRLIEQELAESMETSRGPVRDALKILETEGLVTREPHRGAFVTELKQEDVIEIYTLREVLERLALRYAIRNATDEQIDELAKIVEEMENLAQQDYDQIEATDLDMKFHYTLCKISGHQRVLNAWVSLSSQIRLVVLKHRFGNPKDHRDRSVSWHHRIVSSLQKRDLELAEKELHVHMAASLEWMGNHADY